MPIFVYFSLFVAFCAAASWQPASAQPWPQRSVKILVPFPPGGPSDSMARATAQRLTESFGQPFVVENRPGAAGAIAGEAALRAPADGYTLYWVTAGQTTIPPAITTLSYEPMKEFSPITAVGENHFALVANHRNLPVGSVAEFIRYVKENPGKVSYAHAGRGNITHLAMELLLHRAKIKVEGVPYKGIGPAFTDVVAGHVPTMFASLAEAVEHEKSGAIRVLAVSTRKRSARTPSTPTVSEAGIPDFEIVSWNGLVARSETPRTIIQRIAGGVKRAASTPEFAMQLRKLGFEPIGSSPDEFAAAISAETPVWLEAIKSASMNKE